MKYIVKSKISFFPSLYFISFLLKYIGILKTLVWVIKQTILRTVWNILRKFIYLTKTVWNIPQSMLGWGLCTFSAKWLISKQSGSISNTNRNNSLKFENNHDLIKQELFSSNLRGLYYFSMDWVDLWEYKQTENRFFCA